MESNSTDPIFNVTLSFQGVSTAEWNETDGSQGLWVGLGYATDQMENADFTMCVYYYYGPENSTFACADGKMKSSNQEDPPYIWDESQDIGNITTLQQEFFSENNTANFKVQFTRPFRTNDSQNDTELTFEDTSFIWAHGQVSSGLLLNHGPSRGNEMLDLRALQLVDQNSILYSAPLGTPTRSGARTERTGPYFDLQIRMNLMFNFYGSSKLMGKRLGRIG